MARSSQQFAPLSKLQYEFIRGQDTPADPDGCRYDIRKRLQYTISNGGTIWFYLPQEEREMVFQTLENANKQKIEPDTLQDIEQLHDGVIGWLSFLYAGVAEANHVHLPGQGEPTEEAKTNPDVEEVHPAIYFDFETMLQAAIERVARARGERVTNFEFTVETEPLQQVRETVDLKDAYDRFQDGDSELSAAELSQLEREGYIDEEERREYFEQLTAGGDLFETTSSSDSGATDAEE